MDAASRTINSLSWTHNATVVHLNGDILHRHHVGECTNLTSLKYHRTTAHPCPTSPKVSKQWVNNNPISRTAKRQVRTSTSSINFVTGPTIISPQGAPFTTSSPYRVNRHAQARHTRKRLPTVIGIFILACAMSGSLQYTQAL